MGEISEALRRAKKARGDSGAPEAQVRKGRLGGRWRGDPESAPRDPAPQGRHRAELPSGRTGEWKSRAVAVEPRGLTAEACRHLALRLRSEMERRGIHSVAMAGALRGEGKTLLACDVALAMASLSHRREVALLDLDLRKPSVAQVFQIGPEVGIEDCLDRGANLSDVCISLERPGLDVYPVRQARSDAHELLIRPEFGKLIRELESRYAVVVVDTPPAVLVPDSSLILKSVGGWAAVVRAGATRKRLFQNMLSLLPRERLLGGIVNEGRMAVSGRGYDAYGYGPDEPAPSGA